MSSITFMYQGMSIDVKCSKGEKLDSIVQRFAKKLMLIRTKSCFYTWDVCLTWKRQKIKWEVLAREW